LKTAFLDSKTPFLGGKNTVYVKQKGYKNFLGVPLRAEIEQNLSKIKQNLFP